MLDFRHETFLALCRIKSYTKTAEALHLTQPAVTQHIKALEAHYGNRLFTYSGKTLALTEHGELLYRFASTVASDSGILTEMLHKRPCQTLLCGLAQRSALGNTSCRIFWSRFYAADPTSLFRCWWKTPSICCKNWIGEKFNSRLLKGFSINLRIMLSYLLWSPLSGCAQSIHPLQTRGCPCKSLPEAIS